MIYKFGATAVSVTAAALLAMAPAAMARDYHHGHRHHHRYYHHQHRDHDNVGAGIAGFAAGAILGGALASHPHRRDYYAYQPGPDYSRSVRWCMHHYRSYDPRTETYLGYDGYRHHCP